jgi:D-alanine-D-alanine ligase
VDVGLTYDLREAYLAQGLDEEATAEFDAPETIAAIEAVLRRRGFVPERIGGVRELAARLVDGERFGFVFNIAEGLGGIAREAQVPALLEAYDIPYTFSDPLTLALTLDKAMAKRVVRDHGIPTAPFAVVAKVTELNAIALPFPLFVKPLAEGSGKGISAACHVNSALALKEVSQALLERFKQPLLIETYLPGREFTVGLVGNGADTRVLGVMEIDLRANAESFCYSYANKASYQARVGYHLVDDDEARRAATTALAAWRALRGRDGGRIDVRSDEYGEPQFLEINPLPGLHPVHSDLVIMARLTGVDYSDLLGFIIDACLKRCGHGGNREAAQAVGCS